MFNKNQSTFTISGASCQTKWVLQGIISRASFRRQPLSGQGSFTVMSLRICYNFAKKRGIGKKIILTIHALMLEDHADVVAGDFKGAAWRRDSSNSISIIEEAFADCALPMPPGSSPLWGPEAVPGMWADVCGLLKRPDSHERWKVRQHGAFSIPHEALGIHQTHQSCHHEVWLHLDFVERRSVQSHHEKHNRRILLKERSAPHSCNKEKGHISEDVSDHSLSS